MESTSHVAAIKTGSPCKTRVPEVGGIVSRIERMWKARLLSQSCCDAVRLLLEDFADVYCCNS